MEMNLEKKAVFINGYVQLPLKIGASALIIHANGQIWTSVVKAIHQVAEDLIVFETRNSTYCVASHIAPEPAAMAAQMYACA
ncbi:MAG: hypothetical protein LBL26_03405 [Peptococcaceae bacterium]|jgi:hypothetical protein|nr:hypothetical protein [Peptococcaceae bacterium]